jgi:hypothetical protein
VTGCEGLDDAIADAGCGLSAVHGMPCPDGSKLIQTQTQAHNLLLIEPKTHQPKPLLRELFGFLRGSGYAGVS